MNINALSGREVARRTVHMLGLDETAIDVSAPEAICSSLRRAASFLCPATPRELVDAVMEVLGPLDDSSSVARGQLATQLDLLVAIGDLVELPNRRDRGSRRLYLAPPSYVTKAPGRYLLLGVRPDGVPLLDEPVGADVRHEGHVRSIEMDATTGPVRLRAAGLHEISIDDWRRQPSVASASAIVRGMRQRLDWAAQSGSVSDLTLLDPESSVLHYRGRWRPPTDGDCGDYVARRPQAYGADLWCSVRVESGLPRALIDLPTDDPAVSACDEAWRLQAAIDAARGRPQLVRIRSAGGAPGSRTLDLFGPVPGWAQRYLELVGIPGPRAWDALITYRVPLWAIGELTEFFTDMLWMQVNDEGGAA
ncbi:hypothetical protein IPZ61_04710 [Streptomyces sioyaensis]|uniref:hypothetical protein n=1 Tax=Streptomyces sioyaensis TaxID=67364 RepID=UPI001F3236C3|nr:hypothetical protein [Streptomyces sioyaensis]MCF3172618.1 hypothetical protein [Streptomyces sioyaensis]